MSLAGYIVFFSIKIVFILLPNRLVSNIFRDLEFEDFIYLPPLVSCNKLVFILDIIFNLAGKNFTLILNNYTFE